MLILIESLIIIILFTGLILSLSLKNPIAYVNDFPPAIKKRCIEMQLIKEDKQKYKKRDIIRKGIALLVIIGLLSLLLNKLNGATTFKEGFLEAYFLWFIINWYDALVIDCLLFCHIKWLRIPGTEDMPEYKDYLFHIKKSCWGMVIGVPACLLVGLLVMFL